MKKLLIIIIALFVTGTAGAKARSVKHTVKKEAPSKFRKELSALIYTANQPSGFESLKQVELSRGVWNCKLELDGFIPTVEEVMHNPASKLVVSAISVTPAARSHAKMLLLKGLKGYTMKDSNKDKTMLLDRSKYLRKVVFNKKERNVESTVTVLFLAHRYESVQIIIEAWQ